MVTKHESYPGIVTCLDLGHAAAIYGQDGPDGQNGPCGQNAEETARCKKNKGAIPSSSDPSPLAP